MLALGVKRTEVNRALDFIQGMLGMRKHRLRKYMLNCVGNAGGSYTVVISNSIYQRF